MNDEARQRVDEARQRSSEAVRREESIDGSARRNPGGGAMTLVRLVLVGSLLGAVFMLGGCRACFSEINTELSHEQLVTKVREHFHTGMSRDEVRQELVDLGTDWGEFNWGRVACDDAVENAFVVDVWTWGLRCALGYNSGRNLLFSVDKDDRLTCVGYLLGNDWDRLERIMP